MIIKCKMCGGDIDFIQGTTYGTCEYCGSTSTIPKADDEGKLNRYNRANHFRRQGEFDKAAAAYEKILEQDDTDAEAHWGAVISRYGIEYVEDPSTGARVPTCHRLQLASILSDEDYKAALEYAPDDESRRIYREEGARIAEIQKGILAISQNEKPYDVFICYKETDETGQRTHDSQWAQDVYYGLTEQGYKVFFSRITLEDKLGQEYEPYIFAALNSAKVMVVIGSKPEYFNAVWVRNEWSRYLKLMANDRGRLLIPCYRGMDPYDLPDELSSLQSQDMGKIGFMQDLIRGVKKVLDADKKAGDSRIVQPMQSVNTENANVAALLTRASLALEDGDFSRADNFCEQALNLEATNPKAYIYKLMVELGVKYDEELSQQKKPLDSSGNYRKALRFADDKLKAKLQGWNQMIIDRIEAEKYAEEEAERQRQEAKRKRMEEELKHLEKVNEIRQLEQTLMAKFKEEIQMYNRVQYEAAALQMAKQKLADKQDILRSMRERVNSLKNEIANLRGLFTGNRKKELEAQLQLTMHDIREVENQISKLAESARRDMPIIPEKPDERDVHYQIAVLYLQNKLFDNAYQEFKKCRDYKDTELILETDPNLKTVEDSGVLEDHKIVTFGHYPQAESGMESTPIEWIVLEINGQKALLISRYGLEVKPFNSSCSDVTWESCSLRTWLNETFLNKAFSTQDQRRIVLTHVNNHASQGYYSVSDGKDTEDRIFLLSYAEAWKYFVDNSARQCKPTKLAAAQGAYTSSNGNCWWWLRSQGSSPSSACRVDCNGALTNYNVNSSNDVVRPALWMDLSKI